MERKLEGECGIDFEGLTAKFLSEELVAKARAAGADEADAVSYMSIESSVTVRKQRVEKIIESQSRTVGLRVIVNGSQAVVSTADVSDEALDDAVNRALELAAISEPDEFAGLPELSNEPELVGNLAIYDEAIEALTTQDKIDCAMACENEAFTTDRRICNSDGATYGTDISEIALANSRGFSGNYLTTMASLSIEVMAEESDGRLWNDYWSTAERQLHRLEDPYVVGSKAAFRALRQIGARKLDTQRVPVVWEPTVAASLVNAVAMAASGDAYFRRNTFLSDLEDNLIASSNLRIVDDGTLPTRLGSRPFDAEGVRTRCTSLIDNGVFKGFLFDTYNARRTGRSSTGSAVRGVGSLPMVGSGNLVVEPGQESPEKIIGGLSKGLDLTSLMGFGTNIVTGDFSRGASGLWIRDGELAEPVTEINVSGRIQDMLMNIDAIGNDLQWFGSIAVPTIRISEMTVSGL